MLAAAVPAPHRKMKNILIILFLIYAEPAFANNLVISNVTLEDRNPTANTVVVQFNISWDHSWRKADNRRDAAWVFVKLLDAPAGTPSYPWLHGKLLTAGTNPNDGTSVGSNKDLQIVIPTDKIGAFIERRVTGNGAVASQAVRLVVDYGTSGAADSDTITAKVFGIEMVYIPEGPFYIGDGDGQNESTYAFHQNGVDNTAVQITRSSVTVTSDSNANDDIDTSPVAIDGDGGITGNTSWPVGFNAFYLMKYEMTQAQYRDFLNTLSRVQQGTRVRATVSGNTIANYYVMANVAFLQQRQGIRAPASGNGTSPTQVVFGCDINANGTFNEADDGLDLAMNYLKTTDAVAYADWAGLRPYTETEFEKAARGPNSAVYGEYAWGSTIRTSCTSAALNSARNSEYCNQSGEGLTNIGLSGNEVMRVGFAATQWTNRKSAAAGYYGNSNLCDNVNEKAVTVGNSTGRAFAGTNGDGVLTTTASFEGNATNNDWPGINGTTNKGVTGATGYSADRGGDTAVASQAVSDRTYASQVDATGDFFSGGRFARTAP